MKAITYLATSEKDKAAVLPSRTTAAMPNLRTNCFVAGMLQQGSV